MSSFKSLVVRVFLPSVICLFSYRGYSQDIALVNKIVGNGDAANYYIGHFPVLDSDGLDLHWYGGIRFGDYTSKNVMQITNGKVGIGTPNPLAKLEVSNGSILVRDGLNIDNQSSIMIAYSINEGNVDTFGTSIRSIIQNAGSNTYGLQFFTQESHLTNQTEKVRILGNGNVGIGTKTPDSKLTVAGNIHAQEVKVSINAGIVPDYVFANDYKLKSLNEVEQYIKQNNHLPEIPSAQEVEKNGLMLAEMNMNLLKKIEELTLYVIEQEKMNNKQSLRIEVLEKENEILKKVLERLSEIEEKLK
ncbi:hypothetical protein JI750_05885 [Flavobacterium sp. GN10]|uniref:Uncharacterized protein n=1 Tax=Flavobacterium tagetis TaxID=2801336 RepID=A0ABS1KAA7_9FLAO|nr:tail fiber protein [Flavobacterium tagetis]MBL0736406.1 hypothetical protein [Flavobacterium tagetis]